jgi:hypothetical protein
VTTNDPPFGTGAEFEVIAARVLDDASLAALAGLLLDFVETESLEKRVNRRSHCSEEQDE